MFRAVGEAGKPPTSAPELRLAPPLEDDRPLEIPYAIRWLVPKGERFANFDILNDNDTQLDYYRRFGHIYAVGIPTKKWRLVVVSPRSSARKLALERSGRTRREPPPDPRAAARRVRHPR